VDLQHLRAFVAVSREGNLTRAAQRLHLTQAAVSVQLKSLQQELDLTLLVRTTGGLTLTKDGKEVLPYAERILAAVSALEDRASSMQESVRGTLGLGTTLNPELTRLGPFLQKLVSTHPQIRTRLRHGMSGSVRQSIQSGELDAGYYVAAAPEELDHELFFHVELTIFNHLVVAPRGWRERVIDKGWKELAALPWIWAPDHSVHSRLLNARFKPFGVRPNVVAEADVEASMLDMVRSGIGLALAREAAAIREAQANGLVVMQSNPLPAQLSFACLRTRQHEPIICAAFEAVKSVFD
jgi:DNA-binding transcriptional LysR family regulator